MVELFAVARFGPDAAFSLSERFFIEAPLARLIEKYGNVADQFGGLIDPVLVLAGAALYAIRLSGMAINPVDAPQPDKPQGSPAALQTDKPGPGIDGAFMSMLGGALDR